MTTISKRASALVDLLTRHGYVARRGDADVVHALRRVPLRPVTGRGGDIWRRLQRELRKPEVPEDAALVLFPPRSAATRQAFLILPLDTGLEALRLLEPPTPKEARE